MQASARTRSKMLAGYVGELGEGLAGLGLVYAVLLLFTLGAKQLVSDRDLAGTPQFALVTQVTFQCLVSPLVLWWGWSEQAWSYDWLVSRYETDPPTTAATLYMWLIMGIMAKDGLVWMFYHESPDTPLLALHHIACFIISIYCLYREIIGAGLFIVGTVALELGSAFSTLSTLFPTSRAVLVAFLVVMTASNVLAAACILDHMRHLAADGDWIFVGIHGIVSPVLLFMRQDVANQRLANCIATGNADIAKDALNKPHLPYQPMPAA